MRRRFAAEQYTDEMLKPGLAIAQALQQRDIGEIRQLDRHRSGACRAKPYPAQAISQDKPKQVGSGFDRPWPKESPRLAGGGVKRGRPAKPR